MTFLPVTERKTPDLVLPKKKGSRMPCTKQGAAQENEMEFIIRNGFIDEDWNPSPQRAVQDENDGRES